MKELDFTEKKFKIEEFTPNYGNLFVRAYSKVKDMELVANTPANVIMKRVEVLAIGEGVEGFEVGDNLKLHNNERPSPLYFEDNEYSFVNVKAKLEGTAKKDEKIIKPKTIIGTKGGLVTTGKELDVVEYFIISAHEVQGIYRQK